MPASDTSSKPGTNAPPNRALEAAAWAAAAEDLADWAWAGLVNRADAWGRYGGRGPWTAKGQLGWPLLVRHFRARSRAEVLGLHSTGTDNTCLWGALDIDWHGPTSTAPAVNLRAAQAWYGRLVRMGFRPLLCDSNGRGGFHLAILFAAAVATARVFHFLKWLIADHRTHGMASAPETFPKQPQVAPAGQPGQFGNWLRVPGRHHTQDHWSRVWDGSCWLEGTRAVEFILALGGDLVDLVPELPAGQPAPRPVRRAVAHAGGNLSAVIARYLARLPNGGEGTGRDDTAYNFACFLVRDLALADDIALAWLQRWDAGNNPPKGRARLEEILAGAHRYGRNAYGCGRPATTQRRDRHGHVILTSSVEVK
jgi:hypothetical protein